MGLFRRDPPVPEKPLPIPRSTMVWPKAVAAVKPATAVAPPPPPAVVKGPAFASQTAAPARLTPLPPHATSSAPTIVKPSCAAPAAPSLAAIPKTAAAEGPAPAGAKDASSVVAAFASWKQATAAKTAVAGKTETASATSSAAVASAGPSPTTTGGRREDPVMYVYRAAAKQARGDHDAAIEDLTKALEIDPTCTTAWAGRAMSLEAKGDLAGAKRDYAKSIEIELRQEIARIARPL